MSSPTKNGWITVISLVRPLNLVFIVLAQYLLLYRFIIPALRSGGAPVLLSEWRGVFFLAVTALLAGAGYVINDLLDVNADRINKPGKWYVGNRIGKKAAMTLALIMVLSGGFLSAWIAIGTGKPGYWLIYPSAALALWVYSRYLKGVPLAGNFLVAMLCSLVGGIIWFAEREGIRFLQLADLPTATRIIHGIGFYLFFAFLATFFREIVKDCEDVEGDATAGRRTFPVRFGLRKAVRLAFVSGLALDLSLLFLSFYFFEKGNHAGVIYSLAVLALPLSAGLYLLTGANALKQFSRVSRIAKWVIFAGVFLVLLF